MKDDLTKLIKTLILFKTQRGILLDVLLTNKLNSFQETVVCDTVLDDCHKLKLIKQVNHFEIQSNLSGTLLEENIVSKPRQIKLWKKKDKHDEISTKGNDLKNDKKVLVAMFNKFYINVIQKAVGLAPKVLGKFTLAKENGETVAKVIKTLWKLTKHFQN